MIVPLTLIAPPASACTGDYHLAWNSPLIDAGNTGLVSASSSATDLDRNPREVPSSTSSSSPLDLGAYEYRHRAPTVVATAAPLSAAKGAAITFDGAHSSDPDDGDTLTHVWSFDDGATATGATVTHAFSTPGTHAATLVVTDPTGLTSTQTIAVTVSSPPAKQSTPTMSTPGTNTNPAPLHLTVLGNPTVTGSKVTLKLSCTGSAACTGIHVGEATIKAHRQTVQVASARLSLNPGQTKTITLTLNGQGNTLLAQLGKLPVTITVTMTTAGKKAIVKSAHATLHRPKKPAHRHP